MRVVSRACAVVLAIAWLAHAGLKMYQGIGSGTLYADWTASRVWLHWGWCCLEAALGAWLLSGMLIRPAVYSSIFLLAMLTGLILLEPTPKPCGCGSRKQVASREAAIQDMRWNVGRNGVLLALAFVALVTSPVGSGSEPHAGAEPKPTVA